MAGSESEAKSKDATSSRGGGRHHGPVKDDEGKGVEEHTPIIDNVDLPLAGTVDVRPRPGTPADSADTEFDGDDLLTIAEVDVSDGTLVARFVLDLAPRPNALAVLEGATTLGCGRPRPGRLQHLEDEGADASLRGLVTGVAVDGAGAERKLSPPQARLRVTAPGLVAGGAEATVGGAGSVAGAVVFARVGSDSIAAVGGLRRRGLGDDFHALTVTLSPGEVLGGGGDRLLGNPARSSSMLVGASAIGLGAVSVAARPGRCRRGRIGLV